MEINTVLEKEGWFFYGCFWLFIILNVIESKLYEFFGGENEKVIKLNKIRKGKNNLKRN